MKLENNISIKGEKDNCTIKLNDDGSVFIGSITLEPGEIEEFQIMLAAGIIKLQLSRNSPDQNSTAP